MAGPGQSLAVALIIRGKHWETAEQSALRCAEHRLAGGLAHRQLCGGFSVHTPTPMPASTRHYENFPVASWLCPARLRPPIAAIYAFARTADDIADEGDAPAGQRLNDLAMLRADLMAARTGQPNSGRWPRVFEPLARMIAQFNLPVPLLADLLDAFEQDVVKTRDGSGYTTRAELLDYCRRSANPVGRLVLHLYGVHDEPAQQMSDSICTALQLINFWQDLGLDIARGRYYLPLEECKAHGVSQADLTALHQTQKVTKLIADNVDRARATMLIGSQLVHQVPGRAGWELRLVVQGGLRILDKIEALNYATLNARPKLTAWDVPVMLVRALAM
jgi:hydroxysqualene synthase